VLMAQWVLNVLQFLTLIGVIWYSWETRKSGIRVSQQYEREWKPQLHFSLRGLDPTTGTGQLSGFAHKPVKLTVNIINLGRPALVIRGFLISPVEAVKTSIPIDDPLALATGKAGECKIPLEPLLNSLAISEQIPRSGSYSWRGKVSLALWFEANAESHMTHEQYFEMEIHTGTMISVRQITQVEFEHLTRVATEKQSA